MHALGEFRDILDRTDFEGQHEEVTEVAFERDFVVRLFPGTGGAEARAELVRAMGIPTAELIREWAREKIKAV